MRTMKSSSEPLRVIPYTMSIVVAANILHMLPQHHDTIGLCMVDLQADDARVEFAFEVQRTPQESACFVALCRVVTVNYSLTKVVVQMLALSPPSMSVRLQDYAPFCETNAVMNMSTK